MSTDKDLAQLEDMLRRQLSAHGQLLATLGRKLAALRTANHRAVAACVEEENAHVQQIAEMEKARLELVAKLTLAVEPNASQPLRLNELAERFPEPVRGRLLVLRAQLMEKMEQVQRESSVSRRAAESLLRHMQGLMQTIGSVMTGVNTYGRTGAPPRAAMAVSTFSATA